MHRRHLFLRIVLVSVLFLVFAAPHAAMAAPPAQSANDVHYAIENGSDINDCLSWANACSLIRAIATAEAGDEVWVAAGAYTPGTNRADAIRLKENVKVFGGFAATATTRSERDWQANRTILTGDIGAAGDAADNSYHVVVADDPLVTSAAMLDGFTIIAGNATSASPNDQGGGIYLADSSPTLANLLIEGNTAVYGGGIYSQSGSPLIYNTALVGNTAYAGGGLYTTGGSPEMVNVTFAANLATNGSGIYNAGSSPVVRNSILWDSGTEVRNSGGSASITYSLVRGGDLGLGNIDTNPLFVRAPAPGADGVWGSADDDYGDLRLQGTSPALEVGSDASLPLDSADMDGDSNTTEAIPFDLGKQRRLVFRVDMGAYEEQPARLYVNDDAPAGVHTGRAWATALTSLQEAIDTVRAPGGEVWVAAGVYKPATSDPNPRNASFVMRPGVQIYGGFAATEASLDQRSWETNITTLSCDIGQQGVNTDNCYHVLYNSDRRLTSADRLDGFTITGGNANGGMYDPEGEGGGMVNYSSSPTLANLIFVDNAATGPGGGLLVAMNGGDLSVDNVTFTRNTAGVHGGGAYIFGVNLTMTRAAFYRNSAKFGGGMAFSFGCLMLSDFTISGNTSTDRGGGLLLESSFSGTRNNFSLINGVFTGNTGGNGAGIYVSNSNLLLTNAVFVGNRGSLGGGLSNLNTTATLVHVTFTANMTMGYPSGTIHNYEGSVNLYNSIVWGASNEEVASSGPGATVTIRNSDMQYFTSSDPTWGNRKVDPQFERNPQKGPDGVWGTADDDYGDLRLKTFSPLINRGSSGWLPADLADLDGDGNRAEALPFDLAGKARVLGADADMGAYESLPPYQEWIPWISKP